MIERFQKRRPKLGCAIYLAGHSLGGGTAAILGQMQFVASVSSGLSIHACYMFGAPRISNSNLNISPFATRRYLDIVPHYPPSLFNYVDFSDQKAPDGKTFADTTRVELYFFFFWLAQLARQKFSRNHSMEQIPLRSDRRGKTRSRYTALLEIRLAQFRAVSVRLLRLSYSPQASGCEWR